MVSRLRPSYVRFRRDVASPLVGRMNRDAESISSCSAATHPWPSNIPPAGASVLLGVIEDTGEEKSYFVTKLGKRLSKGAKKHSDFKNISHRQISADATTEGYLLVCLDHYFIGTREMCDIRVTNSLSTFIDQPDGTRREVSIKELRLMPKGSTPA